MFLFFLLPQRVIIVCFEMGIPYFKVSWGTRLNKGPRALEIFLTSPRTWKGGERERIREDGVSRALVNDG